MCLIYIVLCYTGIRVDSSVGDDQEEEVGTEQSVLEDVNDDKGIDFPSDFALMLNGTKKTKADDPFLLKYIQDHVVPPAPHSQPLHLSQVLHTGQVYPVL